MTDQPDEILMGQPGKLPAVADPRTLNVSDYIDIGKANVPAQLDWTQKKKTPWRMMRNWRLNDCTCAAAGHMIECWTANATREQIIHDRDVLDAFIALTGYDPQTGKNNNPVYLADALKHWRKKGIGSHKIKAYASVDYTNHDMIRACTYFFGGVYVGFDLPASIKGQALWDVMPGGLVGNNTPGSFGGHAVNLVAYDDTYLTCISFGKIQKMTWAFWDAYCDELYAIITEDFFNHGATPTGLDLSMLETHLLSITDKKGELQKQLIKNQTIMKKATATTKPTAGTSGGKGGTKGSETNADVKKKPVAAGNGGKKS